MNNIRRIPMSRVLQYFSRRSSNVLELMEQSFDAELATLDDEPAPQPVGFRDRAAIGVVRGVEMLNAELDMQERMRDRLKAELAKVEANIGELNESLAILSRAAADFTTLATQAVQG